MSASKGKPRDDPSCDRARLPLSYDIIIVGAGHNGLVAGNILARAGWSVLILEAEAEPGGAVRTAEVTLPGFRHDLYATNLNAFVGSTFFEKFGPVLATHGLELVRASSAFCSVFPDGGLIGITNSLKETVAGLHAISPHDALAWQRLNDRFGRIGPPLLALLRQPMPSKALLKVPFDAMRLAAQSTRAFVEAHFTHEQVRALWAVWGMHLDFPPDIRGGALYAFLQCMLIQRIGISFAKGGAAALTGALVGMLRASGGEIRCSAPVTEILVERGAAIGVRLGSERIAARRGVIANLTPAVLFRLVKELSPRRYRYGPGTMMIHLALSDLPDWRNPRAREFAYIHIAPSLGTMSCAYRDAMAGALPKEPALVVAQPTLVDPSRAPPGRHVVSIQVRVVPVAMDKERYADHVVALIERHAPGLRDKILGRHVISPGDLERSNANLVGGDSVGGSHHLRQQFIFRPYLGWSRHRTPIDRLYLCGAATWPGAGVGAGSGWLLGQRLTQG